MNGSHVEARLQLKIGKFCTVQPVRLRDISAASAKHFLNKHSHRHSEPCEEALAQGELQFPCLKGGFRFQLLVLYISCYYSRVWLTLSRGFVLCFIYIVAV